MTDWSKYLPSPMPVAPTNDDTEFDRGIGASSARRAGPDDEELKRGVADALAAAQRAL